MGLGAAGTLAAGKGLSGSTNGLVRSSGEQVAQTLNRLMMLSINVSSMQKAKTFYAEKLGLKIASEYRIDDDNWWVSLAFPGGGAVITLARAGTYPESIKPHTLSLYISTPDIEEAHKKLSMEGLTAGPVQDDLFGPGSGVKFLRLEDPDGNLVHIVQEHESRVPF